MKLYVVSTRDSAYCQRYALCRVRSPGSWPTLENCGAIALCAERVVADKLATLWNIADAAKAALEADKAKEGE